MILLIFHKMGGIPKIFFSAVCLQQMINIGERAINKIPVEIM